jgi:glucose-6-phosphate isomerase
MLSIDVSALRGGEFALDDAQWDQLSSEVAALHAHMHEQRFAGKVGFLELPYQSDEQISKVEALAEVVQSHSKYFVVIGIGGSDLGVRAVHRALNPLAFNRLNPKVELHFVGDTTDPQVLHEVLAQVDLTQTTLCMISKSGSTVEQASSFLILRDLLTQAVGTDEARKRIIAITDPATGALRQLVNEEGYQSLEIPSNVGGRFSVFSAAGLFPLAVVGVAIRELLAGAKAMDQWDQSEVSLSNPALAFGVLHMHLHEKGVPMAVFMPYQHSLREVGFWFRQLWAESLGKALSASGEALPTKVSPTPIAALGPTDQHSQLQLYMEGRTDKVFTIVTVAHQAVDYQVPEAFAHIESLQYLGGKSLSTILQAEATSTADALIEMGKPVIRVQLDELSATTIGELLYFLELATAYAGWKLGVNPFDQPGVERSKQLMYHLLGRW